MPNEFKISPIAFNAQLPRSASLLLAISIWEDVETLALADSFGAWKLLSKIDLGNILVPRMIASLWPDRRWIA
jgi:hypothetical protein